MNIPRIYCPQPLSLDRLITLDKSASKHLLKSLRLKIGDSVFLFDGKGSEFLGQITAVSNSQSAEILLKEKVDQNRESFLSIHLVYGLARFEKTEWVIQKATELGVQKITLVMTQHGEVHLKGQSVIEKKMARWQSIIISACEQSGRQVLPELELPIKLDQWLKSYSPDKLALLFHLKGAQPLSCFSLKQSKTVTLLVGPEGGFSKEEVEMALNKGFQTASLGPRTLRTETAAVSAVSLAQGLWGDGL